MNLKNNLKILSFVVLSFSVSLLLLIVFAVMHGESACAKAFAMTALASLMLFFTFRFVSGNHKNGIIRIKDGYFVVTATWLLFGALGALPFIFAGVVSDFPSAFFETISGFTTTGATGFSDVESLPSSMIFYRSLTNFLGGMGVVVLFVALMPRLGNAGMKFTSQEMAGTNKDKILPKSRDSAKYLWLIYIGLTVAMIILLLCGGLTPFQAVCISLSAMSTAGFTPYNNSIEYFSSAYVDVVVTVFMFIAALNFSLIYLTLNGDRSALIKDTEARTYFAIVASSSVLIALSLTFRGIYPSFIQSLRYSAFQYVSMITTTGYTNADFSNWPLFARIVLFTSYFLGGCQGSTGGGVKIIRVCIVFVILKSIIKQKLHPRGVFVVKFESDVISRRFAYEIISFLFVYYLIAIASAVLLTLDPQISTMESAFSSSLQSIGNVGAGFSLPPFGSTTSFSKILMSFEMLVGRLEIFTVGALFTRAFWKK